jgi:hypothetical protein
MLQKIGRTLTRIGLLATRPAAFGIVATYAISWPFFLARDVRVVRVRIAGNVDDDLVYNAYTAPGYDIRRKPQQLGGVILEAAGIASGPTQVDPQIAALSPSQLLQSRAQCGDTLLPERIAFGGHHKHAEPPYLLRLLRARRERPRECCAAQSGYKSPPCDVDRHRTLQRGHAHGIIANDSTSLLRGP